MTSVNLEPRYFQSTSEWRRGCKRKHSSGLVTLFSHDVEGKGRGVHVGCTHSADARGGNKWQADIRSGHILRSDRWQEGARE